MARMLSALSLLTAMGTGMSAQEFVKLDPSTIRPGQALVVELSGNLLKDYLRCCNEAEDDVKGISFCVVVQQRLDDGRFVIEHSK